MSATLSDMLREVTCEFGQMIVLNDVRERSPVKYAYIEKDIQAYYMKLSQLNAIVNKQYPIFGSGRGNSLRFHYLTAIEALRKQAQLIFRDILQTSQIESDSDM